MRYFLITDSHDTLTGMRLAGIEGVLCHEDHEIQGAIVTAIKDKSIGILLVSERCARRSAHLVEEIKNSSKSPLLVEIPDRHGTGRSPDSITRFIRESIGIKL